MKLASLLFCFLTIHLSLAKADTSHEKIKSRAKADNLEEYDILLECFSLATFNIGNAFPGSLGNKKGFFFLDDKIIYFTDTVSDPEEEVKRDVYKAVGKGGFDYDLEVRIRSDRAYNFDLTEPSGIFRPLRSKANVRHIPRNSSRALPDFQKAMGEVFENRMELSKTLSFDAISRNLGEVESAIQQGASRNYILNKMKPLLEVLEYYSRCASAMGPHGEFLDNLNARLKMINAHSRIDQLKTYRASVLEEIKAENERRFKE